MHWKGLLVIAVISLLALAVATRVSFLKAIVFPSAPTPS